MVDLSVVIVNWNVRDLLRRCLSSLLVAGRSSPVDQQPAISVEVVVVDNGSTDGSVEMVRAEFPQVRLIANPDNRGFTVANNQGIEVAQGRYVLLLNPDTEVLGDALATMVAFADGHPDVGVVGPQLLNPDGSVQSSRRRFPTLATAFFESTWLQPYAPRRLLERYYVLDRPEDEVQDVDWVTGAALMARREAIEQVGLLDEGFFMYSEELDWCRRFKEAGWRVVYLPTARIVHYVGKSSEQVLPARHIHFQTSKVRYFRKYHGPLAAEALRWFLLGNYAWQLGLEAAKWAVGHKRPLRAQRIGAYWQVLRSGLRRRESREAGENRI
ncbi:MAG TPA: glycosyltransferase family 2 protein [Chloroflexi bacterium]|nr:glycosyltransferase family 2 protein [Chloroflexota bacterium]